MIRLATFLILLLASQVGAQTSEPRSAEIMGAVFADPTTRYAHGVLGDAIEYGALVLSVDKCPQCARIEISEIRITLPDSRVFEDIEPRLADLDGDGLFEVIVVETDMQLGASLAVYNENGLVAKTDYIGRSHRWLAPAGSGDFDGDGVHDFAFVETPHLGKQLKFWSLKDGQLVQIGQAEGLSNHRIGDDYISGGVRNCNGTPEVITASADWQSVVATKLVNGVTQSEVLWPFVNRQSFADAMDCL